VAGGPVYLFWRTHFIPRLQASLSSAIQSFRPGLIRANYLILSLKNRSGNDEYKNQRVWLLYALKNKISTDNRKALVKPASTGIPEKHRPAAISMQQLGNH